jgi:hypothetical protein
MAIGITLDWMGVGVLNLMRSRTLRILGAMPNPKKLWSGWLGFWGTMFVVLMVFICFLLFYYHIGFRFIVALVSYHFHII